jgi:hypothetical protein
MIGHIIDEFNTPITVRRTNAETVYVNGIAQVATDVDEFLLQGVSVQPLTGQERVLLPELIRDQNLIKLYTQCPLQSVDVEGKLRADRIDYEDHEYVVQNVQNWGPNGCYYKVIAIKEND